MSKYKEIRQESKEEKYIKIGRNKGKAWLSKYRKESVLILQTAVCLEKWTSERNAVGFGLAEGKSHLSSMCGSDYFEIHMK
jgi:hypothetical protein